MDTPFPLLSPRIRVPNVFLSHRRHRPGLTGFSNFGCAHNLIALWTWRATVAGGSHTPGVYIIVADQRAVQLSGGGKPYLMRMMGTLYPVAISPDAPPAALEVAARDRLRALLRAGSGKSGGTDVLSGYGSARVDGM